MISSAEISEGIPARKNFRYLSEAIASAAPSLNEVTAVDDALVNNMAELGLASYTDDPREKCLRFHTNYGPAGAIVGTYLFSLMVALRSLFDRASRVTNIRDGEHFDWYVRVQANGVQIELIDDALLHRRPHCPEMKTRP